MMTEEEEENEFPDIPDRTDFHGNKRELLRRGRKSGKLTWAEIRRALPPENMSEAELEIFLFTCRNLGIDVTD